jgi:glycosyltransferase involved in cell wall biosynthesis
MNRRSPRARIAFLTSRDPRDRKSWSGTYYYMAKALQEHCGDVFFLGPVRPRIRLVGWAYNKLLQLIARRRYDHEHSVVLAKRYAAIFDRKMSKQRFGLVVAPAGSTLIAFLKTTIPVVYLSDTTFALIAGYYPEYSNLCRLSMREGNKVEALAIDKARLVIYPSAWAAQSAVDYYSADKEKVHVVPYGANLEQVPARDQVLGKKRSDDCKLLFLGVNWERKGGDIAFETMLRLREMGIPAELIVCGCTPPGELSHPALKVIPFLDKNDAQQGERLARLLASSDFLLLPTRAECAGIVFCEAAAFGLPVITTDTGGVSGMVVNGENGYMLPINATPAEYARTIYDIHQDHEHYGRLVMSSRKAFEQKLNWDSWALAVKRILIDSGLLAP